MKQKHKLKKEVAKQINKNTSRALIFNLIFTLISLWGINTLFDKNQGYSWIYDSLLKGNMDLINKYPNLSTNERLRMKMGSGFPFLEYIQKNVPKDAIILFPASSEDIFKKKDALKFRHRKIAFARFIHPRKIVKSTEIDNYYYDKITHVAIIDGWGYDKLPYTYTLQNKPQYAILPITPKK